MDKELKDLLLNDLCARLPYGVKVAEISGNTTNGAYEVKVVNKETKVIGFNTPTCLIRCYRNMEMIKPYLRPMSSMSEEEKLQLVHYACIGEDMNGEFIDEVQRKDCHKYIDWLNKHHFDYRGLIEKNLALEAPKDMYKFDLIWKK